MTITEAVRGLTIGDCPTRREAVKTIREYFEGGDPLERIREEIDEYRTLWRPTGNSIDNAGWNVCNKCIEIIDKYRETQAESEDKE